MISAAIFSTAAVAQDMDADGVIDALDNCTQVSNEAQRDTDGDGLGNQCDADLNQDCVINFGDIALFSGLFQSSDATADFNGDGSVGFLDFVLIQTSFLSPPGPSGRANLCGNNLTIAGTTSPVALAGALVTVTVDASATGGAGEVVTTTSGANGSWSVEISGTSGFVTAAIDGVGEQSAQRYVSALGSVSALIGRSGGDGVYDSNDSSDVNLGPLTTVFTVLAGEQVALLNSQDALELAEARVDPSDLLRISAATRRAIVDPAISLPLTDTLTTLSDPTVRQEFVFSQQVIDSPDLVNASMDIITDADAGYVLGETPANITLLRLNNVLSVGGGSSYEFTSAESVNYIGRGAGTSPYVVDSNGAVVLNPEKPFFIRSFATSVEDPLNPGVLVATQAAVLLNQIEVLRFRQGWVADHVLDIATEITVYPEFPSIDPIVTTGSAGPTSAVLAFPLNSRIGFTQDELLDGAIAMLYSHQNNASLGNSEPTLGFDLFDFAADGTGATRRRAFDFTWEINTAGELLVNFTNGDSNRYMRIARDIDDNGIGVVISTISGLFTSGRHTHFIKEDTAALFGASEPANRSYRHSLATTTTTSLPDLVFDFANSLDNTACRNPDSPATTSVWQVVNGRYEFTRTFDIDPPGIFFRTWQPLRRVENRIWVIETLQIAFDGGPIFDAAVTPGRINMYTEVHSDLSNSRPMLGDDFFVTTQDNPINILLSTILANDVDPDGDPLVYRSQSFSTGSAGGTLDNANFDNFYPVALTYTPPAGFVGTETFLYEASDVPCRGNTAPPTATISITVN